MTVKERGGPRWWNVSAAWLGIGTSPGALLIGALIAFRHGGSVPLLSIAIAYVLMFAILWFQGLLGLKPPIGEGRNLTTLTPIYFGPAMQRIIGALIALGMIGWSGFNMALGGAALGRLLGFPHWIGALVIALPVLILSLRGIHSWNGLAALATVSVLALTGFITYELAAPGIPITIALDSPLDVITDVAILLGYVTVFSVRSPDFTRGLSKTRDLIILINLLCLPVLGIALAGSAIYMGTGEVDLVALLAAPGTLSIGNLLIFLSVLAPTFTTLFSGAPGLRAAIGLSEPAGMVIITLIAFILAVFRFDLYLGGWLSMLAALLPPIVVPLAVESTLRRRGALPCRIPIWTWAIGSAAAILLTLLSQPVAPLIGLLLSALTTTLWVTLWRQPQEKLNPI
ncbi:MAG: hypothetical protein GY759_15770 [Chloroflexi bacterium]|nr:hypothetical protein [Chloroflexota bacterium]